MENPQPTAAPKTILSVITATLAALGASLCCLGPVILITMGIGGSWMSSMSALEPYRPIFIAITFIFLFLAYRKLYLLPAKCGSCTEPSALKKQRIIFWIISVIAIALVTFPYYGLLLIK